MLKPAMHRVARLITLAVLSTAVLASCDGSGDGSSSTSRGGSSAMMPGSFAVLSDSGLDSLKVDSILVKVALRSTGFVVAHGRTDVRRLFVGLCNGGEPCVAGPLVRIIPHDSSHVGDSASLAAGKVVAKLVTVGGSPHRGAYSKFAIAAGDSAYEYIEKATVITTVGTKVDTTVILRSVFVPANRANWRMARWRQTSIYHFAPAPHARARFLWNDADDEKWGTCMGGGCCAPPGLNAMEL